MVTQSAKPGACFTGKCLTSIRKKGYQRTQRKTSRARREPTTNSTNLTRRERESNLGYRGWRQALIHCVTPCSPNNIILATIRSPLISAPLPPAKLSQPSVNINLFTPDYAKSKIVIFFQNYKLGKIEKQTATLL